jgi:hypothetical protein
MAKKLQLVKKQQPQEDTYTAPWGKTWTRGANVMATWKKVVINEKTGETWRPPSEYRNDYQFKIAREGGLVD